MQTILGSGGQIAIELARELQQTHAVGVRLVSRHPHKVNDTDSLRSADLLDSKQTEMAVEGSKVVYFTAGVPMAYASSESYFPTMLRNALVATRAAGAKFVYFDNTYMYPRDNRVQTEDTVFAPAGPVSRVRAAMSSMVLEEMDRGNIPVLIARAPEFYGPGKTQGYTNSLIIDRIKSSKRVLVPVRDDRKRSLIWTPDASRALAILGNTPDVYGQTWHLPVDNSYPTYRQFVGIAAKTFDRRPTYTVVPKFMFKAAGVFNPEARVMSELLDRYSHHNLFSDARFRKRFPEFMVTNYIEGFKAIRDGN